MIRYVPRAGQATVRLVGYAYLTSLLLPALVSFVFILGLDLWSPAVHFLRESPSRPILRTVHPDLLESST